MRGGISAGRLHPEDLQGLRKPGRDVQRQRPGLLVARPSFTEFRLLVALRVPRALPIREDLHGGLEPELRRLRGQGLFLSSLPVRDLQTARAREGN